MFKKILSIVLFISLFALIFAQSDQEFGYDKKSVRRAMLLSSLFPGAGQFYADKTSLTTYIFPVLEIGLWAGYLYYYSKGADKEEEYQDFADEYYRRDYQTFAQNTIINDLTHFDNGFYTNHFRLDDSNTQHFYEDIGKYDKYIFGWIDWFDIYATDGNIWVTPNWNWVADSLGVYKYYGLTAPANPSSAYYLGNETLYDAKNGIYSGKRHKYIDMRRQAENYYDKGRFFSFGIVANHMLAALDAVRLAKKHNRQYADSSLKVKMGPVIVNNQLSAAFLISKKF